MYRLLFADDEHIVREGVSSRVQWGENGFELVGVLKNGREVLDYLEDNAIDVLLSDISMPLMDGLAVSREVSSRYPNTVLLLLTGYDQFEYAQEALKYHVNELLLKPITAAELETVLGRVRKELDGRMRVQKEAAELQARLAESIPLLKERFLHRLVLGQLSRDVIRRRTVDLKWEDLNGWYQVVLIHVPSNWEEINRLAATDRAGSLLRGPDESFFNAEEDLVLLLQGPDRDALNERALGLGPEMLRPAGGMAGAPVWVAVGEGVPELMKLRRSYDGALRALGHARLLGLPNIVSAQEVGALRTLSVEGFHDLARELVHRLRKTDRKRAMDAVESLFLQLEHHYLEPDAAHSYVARIQYLLLDFVEELTQVPAVQMPEDVSALLYLQRFSSLVVAREHFRTVVARIVDFLEDQKQVAVVSRVGRAEQIIRDRHAEPGLSLQDICDDVYLSVSQFSALFKGSTGKTFVEYLTEVRIEQAKDLLRTTGQRTYEIADAVGYTDPRYFTYVFKKLTGMTSSEFRKAHNHEAAQS
jgi:two-component system, response regulator YesN